MDAVTLDSYINNGGQAFGSHTAEQLQNLFKALEAGSITGRETTDSLTASGAPLKVESLEKTLKVMTFSENDLVLWQNVPKLPAYNTVEEYNRLVSYGQERGGFNLEGELPEEEDSVYQRKAELVKFLGTTRAVTHPMTLVNTNVGDIVQREISNGTMWILRKVNRALAQASAANIPIEFNGIYQQHQEGYATFGQYLESDLIIDLRGGKLTDVFLNQGVRRIIDNYGTADTLFAPPVVIDGFVSTLYASKYYQVPNNPAMPPAGASVGIRISEFQSQFGDIKLKFDKFLNRGASKTTTTGATSLKAPVAPVAAVAPVAVPADPSSKFAATDAGDYLYAVSATNRYGESAITVLGPAVTVAAGDSVDFAWTDGGGAVPATCYTVYRGKKGVTNAAAATFYPIFTLSTAQMAAGYDGAAATQVRDRNRILTDCDQAFLLENSLNIWSFKQLAPLMKMDLAIVGPAYRFMVLLYGTPILYQPRKVIRFINIGS